MDMDLELDLGVDATEANNLVEMASNIRFNRPRLSNSTRASVLRAETQPADIGNGKPPDLGARKRQRPRGYSPDVGASGGATVAAATKKTSTFVAPKGIPSPSLSLLPGPSARRQTRAESVAVTPESARGRQRNKSVYRYSPSPAPAAAVPTKLTPTAPKRELIKLSDLRTRLVGLTRSKSIDSFDIDYQKLKIKPPPKRKLSIGFRAGSVTRSVSRAASVMSSRKEDVSPPPSPPLPMVRMSDVGAAPFTPPTLGEGSTPKLGGARKGSAAGKTSRATSVMGMIKIPRRHSIERVLKGTGEKEESGGETSSSIDRIGMEKTEAAKAVTSRSGRKSSHPKKLAVSQFDQQLQAQGVVKVKEEQDAETVAPDADPTAASDPISSAGLAEVISSDGRPKRQSAGKSRGFVASVMGLKKKDETQEVKMKDVEKKESPKKIKEEKDEKEKLDGAKPDNGAADSVVPSESTQTGKGKKAANNSKGKKSTVSPGSSTVVSSASAPPTNLFEQTDNVRRSGRSLNLTPKMRQMADSSSSTSSKTTVAADFKVDFKPNSALAIAKNTTLFHRKRSPSPIHASKLLGTSQEEFVEEPSSGSRISEEDDLARYERAMGTSSSAANPHIFPSSKMSDERPPSSGVPTSIVLEGRPDEKNVTRMDSEPPLSLVPYEIDTDDASQDGQLVIAEEEDENQPATPEPTVEPVPEKPAVEAEQEKQEEAVPPATEPTTTDAEPKPETTKRVGKVIAVKGKKAAAKSKKPAKSVAPEVPAEPTVRAVDPPVAPVGDVPDQEEMVLPALPVPVPIEPQPGRSKGPLLSEYHSPAKSSIVSSSDETASQGHSTPTAVVTRKVDTVPTGSRTSRRIIKPTRYDDFVVGPGVVRREAAGGKEPMKEGQKEKEPLSALVPEAEEDRPPLPVAIRKESIGTDGVAKATTGAAAPKPFSMVTRRRSSLDKKERPIKIKLRISGKSGSVIQNTGTVTSEVSTASETDRDTVAEGDTVIQEEQEEEPASVPSLPVPVEIPSKSKSKKKKDVWKNYVPSPKPTIEDLVLPNGQVEKIGISVHTVMDHLLYTVCNDGIKRHSQIISSRDKKKRASEAAKQRYTEKKAEYEKLVAECKEKGEEPPPFSHLLTKQHHTGSHGRRPSVPSADAQLFRSQRSKKGEIYKQNEYLKSAKAKRAMEQEKEEEEDSEDEDYSGDEFDASTRKALNYLQRESNKEMEREMARETARLKRKHEPSTARESSVRYVTSETAEPPRKPIPFSAFLDYKQRHSFSRPTDISLMPVLTPEPPPDFFYRELLTEQVTAITDELEDVDIMNSDTENTALPPQLNEYFDENVDIDRSPMELAQKIECKMMRPNTNAEVYGISELYDRIREESELRRAVVNQAMDVIMEFYVAESTTNGRHAAVQLSNIATKLAHELRDVFDVFSEERLECVNWVHRILIELLPVHFMASYLTLLRYCKNISFVYLPRLVRSTSNEAAPWPEVTEMISDFVGSRLEDPDLEYLNRTVDSNSLSDVIFLLVSPILSVGDFHMKPRAHEHVFRWLKQLGHAESDILKITYEDKDEDSLAEVCDEIIATIVRRVVQLSKEHRDRRIVLVGWQTTCVFNHRAVQLTHGVSALINFGFPLLTSEGPRGTADDDILLTYCPSLFIVGAQAEDYHPIAMKELRDNMLVSSGLVVVGHADSDLFVSTTVLSQTNMTQKAVYRAVVEEVCDFLSLDDTKMERTHLIPLEMNSVYSVEPNIVKARGRKPEPKSLVPKSSVPKPGPVPNGPPKVERRGRKRKNPLPAPPPIPPMPALSAETTVTTAHEARSRFQQVVKKSMGPPSKDARGARVLSERKPAEKKPVFREPRPPMLYKKPSPQQQSPASQAKILDPASISLN